MTKEQQINRLKQTIEAQTKMLQRAVLRSSLDDYEKEAYPIVLKIKKNQMKLKELTNKTNC